MTESFKRKDIFREDPIRCNTPGLFTVEEGILRKDRDPLYFEAQQALPLDRLAHVAQLGFLAPVIYPEQSIYGVPQHSRNYHTLQVARAIELILINNNAPADIQKNGIVAGLLHDIATPAGGDAIKALDPINLDEEINWHQVLNNKSSQFLADNGISQDVMSDTIRNKGLLGKILDVADRIAYTYTDSFWLGGSSLAQKAPLLHKDIGIDFDSEEVYFTNPDKLFDFLTYRAINHKYLYLNPQNRSADVIVRWLTRPMYASDGSKSLSPDTLRSMTDQDLFTILGDHYALTNTQIRDVISTTVNRQHCTTQKEVAALQEELHGETVLLGIDPVRKFNPGVNYKVQDPRSGRILNFEQFDGVRAAELKRLAERISGFYVYYSNENILSDIR